MKYHAALASHGFVMVLCGKQGHKLNRMAGLVDTTSFADLMAYGGADCCEFCAAAMRKRFPNRVENAQKRAGK